MQRIFKKIIKRSYRVDLLVRDLFFLILILLIRLSSPFYKIRFARWGGLFNSRIGHLACNPDCYLMYKDKGLLSKRTLNFFYYRGAISNQQLKKMWERTGLLNILPQFFVRLAELNDRLPGFELNSFVQKDHDNHYYLKGVPAKITFTQDEVRQGEDFLRHLGVPENAEFVCFHNRDPQYLKEVLPPGEDTNFHDFRDSKISNYFKSIEFLNSKNIYAVRMGVCVAEEWSGQKNSLQINYASSDLRSDFRDLYLIWKSRFYIGTSTGLSSIGAVFRRPQLLVNFVFNISSFFAQAPGSIFVIKKIYSHKESRFLKFSEYQKIPESIHYIGDYLKEHGLAFIENSEDDILEAVQEFDSRLNKKFDASKEDIEIQNKFWAQFDLTRYQPRYFEVSISFLKKNLDLI